MGISDALSGLKAFRTGYDQAAKSQESPLTNISKEEFQNLRALFQDTKGRVFDSQSEALAYLREGERDPALADTLQSKGESYDDYMNRVYRRMSEGKGLPGGWSARQASERQAPRAATFSSLPQELQSRVLGLREQYDLAISSTVFQKIGVHKGMQATQEWKALEKDLAPHGMSVTDALGQSRSAR